MSDEIVCPLCKVRQYLSHVKSNNGNCEQCGHLILPCMREIQELKNRVFELEKKMR